ITVVSNAVSPTPPPGMVTVSLSVRATVGTGLEEILSALAAVGVSERDLISFGSSGSSACLPVGGSCSPTVAWSFRIAAPLRSLPETLAKLAGAAKGVKAGVSISYSVYSATSSGAPDCAYAALISTARRHAENLAAAAGLRVGKVTALSDGSG